MLCQSQGPDKEYLTTRIRSFNRPIAVVGSLTSAERILEAVLEGEIPFRGIYEAPERLKQPISLRGQPIQPWQELSKLDPDVLILIGSSRAVIDLQDTIETIRSLCSCRVLPLDSLLDVYDIHKELARLLQFEFDEYLFGRGFFKEAHWHPEPPGIDFEGKTILELGPFEGNNSVMLMAKKPKKVIGLEGRPLNYAKFSVVRSLYNWQNYELLLGDIHLFPSLVSEPVDIIYCSGVHYHSAKPWWLLKSCLESCDTIVLNGHVASSHSVHPKGTQTVTLESGTYDFEIQPEFGWKDNLSGLSDHSLWFKKEDLIHFLNHYGFDYKEYHSAVTGPGLWIFSVVTKRK